MMEKRVLITGGNEGDRQSGCRMFGKSWLQPDLTYASDKEELFGWQTVCCSNTSGGSYASGRYFRSEIIKKIESF